MQREEIKNNWLCEYRDSITSQNGEDGVIRKIFEVIGKENSWCVEFGAGSGKKGNNTWSLITERKWSGVLIEAERALYSDLVKRYADKDNVVCINKAVGFHGSNRLDVLLKNTDIPKNFDFLSIDIDGYDYQVWEALKDYNPRCVMIEINPNIPLTIDFVQPADITACGGSSLLAMVRLGKEKGYELVYAYATNAVFVKKSLFEKFGIKDNSIEQMVCPPGLNKEKDSPTFFQLYDGSLVLLNVKKENMLGYRKKIREVPVWVFEDDNLYPVRFSYDNKIARMFKNVIKKTALYSMFYFLVKEVYGWLDLRKKKKIKKM